MTLHRSALSFFLLLVVFALVATMVGVGRASRLDLRDVFKASTSNLAPAPQGGYTYHRSVTIDHTKVPNTDQTNFPVLISGIYSYLATVANGGNVQNANGYDVIFTSDSSCTTKLDHEYSRGKSTLRHLERAGRFDRMGPCSNRR